MTESEKQIYTLVENDLDDKTVFVVEVNIKGSQKGHKKLLVSLDGENGVSIDQCSKISRKLSSKLEESEMIEGPYTLEVSSYGVGNPLINERQYEINKGRQLRVELIDGEAFEGELAEVNKSGIKLVQQTKKELKEYKIEFKEIVKSQVLISFK